MQPIESLRNLGPQSATWLRDSGIDSIETLREMGAVVAYQIVKRRFPKVSLNLLWSLSAGIQNRDWRELSDDDKRQLVIELEAD